MDFIIYESVLKELLSDYGLVVRPLEENGDIKELQISVNMEKHVLKI